MFKVTFTNNIELTYQLVNEEIVDIWRPMIAEFTIFDCCKNNHYSGRADASRVQESLARLFELSDIISEYAPDHRINRDINADNWRAVLAEMHVHFPQLANDVAYQHIWPVLSEYNDLIHWLENCEYQPGLSKFIISLDFNKVPNVTYADIPKDQYRLFTPYVNFGDLHLGYAHIGRHAQELFFADDLTCPKDQFVPQRRITASIMMYFTEYFQKTDEQKAAFQDAWEKFYEARGGEDFWDYKIDDPMLSFGSIKIGELINITIDGDNYPIPSNSTEIEKFNQRLSISSIVEFSNEV